MVGIMKIVFPTIVKFFFVAVVGVSLDLVLFAAMISVETPIIIANFTSSTLALLAVYQFSVKKVFRSEGSWWRQMLFFLWYFLSITTFSFLANWIHTETSASEFLSKLCIIGPSFLLNFSAVRIILTHSARPATFAKMQSP